MSLNIHITTVEPGKHLCGYATVGDWNWTSAGNLNITVTKLGDYRKEFAVAIHELVEVMLCRERGIHQEDVEKFDRSFEDKREPNNFDEPGDSPYAPYKREHFFATTIERQIVHEFGLDWSKYEDAINALFD